MTGRTQSVESPRDGRLVVVLSFLKAFSIFGYDTGSEEIDLHDFERAYINLVETLRRGESPVHDRLRFLTRHNGLGRNQWLLNLLRSAGECSLLDWRGDAVMLRPGAKQRFDNCLGEFSELWDEDKKELTKVALQSVRYYKSLSTRKRCE